jgi:hypothetical protein
MTPSITETHLLTALRTFLLGVLPAGWDVVRGQANRVAEPGTLNYVVMTPTGRKRLATNVDTFRASDPSPGAPLDTTDYARDTQAEVQLDIHGPSGSDGAQVIATLFRDDYAVQAMGPDVCPLYATDGHQMPFVNAEKQYEDRWVMTAVMQINPIVSTSTEFADTVTVTLKLADGAAT